MTIKDLEAFDQASQDVGKALAFAEINDWMKAQPEYILKETLLEYMIEKVKELV